MSEQFSVKTRGWASTVKSYFECSTLLIFTLSYMYLYRATTIPMYLGLFLNLVSLTGLLYIDESPIWLLKAQRYNEAREVIARVYKINESE